MLLRVLRRSALNDVTTVEEFCELVFPARNTKFDLRPSLYVVVPAQDVQIHAEHAAAAGLELPRTFDHADLDGLLGGLLTSAPGSTGFQLRDTTHHELVFGSEAALLQFAGPLLAQFARRKGDVKRAKIEGHVCQKLAAGDPEWQGFIRVSPKAAAWTRPCAKLAGAGATSV